MRVKEVMEEPVLVDGRASIVEASRVISRSTSGAAIVYEGGMPSGILTEKDIVNKVLGRNIDPGMMKVRDVMSTPIITIDPESHIGDATEKMSFFNIRRLVVADGRDVLGVVTSNGLSKSYKRMVDTGMLQSSRLTPYIRKR